MRITNIMSENPYIKYKQPKIGAATKTLDSAVDKISEDKSCCSVKAASSDYDNYLDTPEAKACEKTILLFSADIPSGIYDIDDLDTLDDVGDDLSSIKDILTVASDKMTTDDDRKRLQKMLDYCLKDIDRIGKNYMDEMLSAKFAAGKILTKNGTDAAEIKDQMNLLSEVTGGGSSTVDAQCKTLMSYADEGVEKSLEAKAAKFKLTDILGISGISVATVKAAKDSLKSVDTAISGVKMQKQNIKNIIKKYVKKAKKKEQEILKTEAGSTSEKPKEALKILRAVTSKVNSSDALQNIFKSGFSTKA